MTGRNIWHVKTRKPGGAEFKFAETQHQPREPRDREVIEVGIGGKIVHTKIMTIRGSHSGSVFWLVFFRFKLVREDRYRGLHSDPGLGFPPIA